MKKGQRQLGCGGTGRSDDGGRQERRREAGARAKLEGRGRQDGCWGVFLKEDLFQKAKTNEGGLSALS